MYSFAFFIKCQPFRRIGIYISSIEANQALAEAVTEFAEQKELAMSAAYVELSVENFAELDRILDEFAVQGERYSAEMERMTGN